MRVTLVSSGSGSQGGGEIYLVFLAKGLVDLGIEVSALVPENERMNELARQLSRLVSVTRFSFQSTYDRKARAIGAYFDRRQQNELKSRFKSLNSDILHINQQVAEDGLDLVRSAASSDVPWTSTIHVGHSAKALGARFGPLRDRLAHFVLREANGIHIVVAEAARMQLAARFEQQAPSFQVVRNGVCAQDWNALKQSRKRARRDWGVQPNEVVIGVVGRIEMQKNPMALIEHTERAVGNGRKIRLVWIGDGAMRTAVEERAKSSQKKIPFVLDGWREDAALRLAGLDLFALPSKFEGLPLAILEAMHAGLPCVASDIDGIQESIKHGETGFTCTSAEEWTHALTFLVDDGKARKRFGQAARRLARSDFSLETMARSTSEVYQSIIASKKTKL